MQLVWGQVGVVACLYVEVMCSVQLEIVVAKLIVGG